MKTTIVNMICMFVWVCDTEISNVNLEDCFGLWIEENQENGD